MIGEPYSAGEAEAATLFDVLSWRAAHQDRKLAYTFLSEGDGESRDLSYDELHQRARCVAAHLQALGIGRARALLLYPPGLEFVTAFFGCLCAGTIAVPVRPPHPARLQRELPALTAIAKDADARVVLMPSSMRRTAEGFVNRCPDLGALRWVTTDDVDENLAAAWEPPGVAVTDTAFIQYTSGSTATPRGVVVSHRSLMHNLAAIERLFGHSSRSVGVIWLPPYHDMGLVGGLLQSAFIGSSVALMSPAAFLQRPLRWLQAITRFRATTSGGPNFAFELCLQRIAPEDRAELDLSSWDLAFVGAEPVRHTTLRRFAAYFEPCGFRLEAFYPCYGLAEATLIVSGGVKSQPPLLKSIPTSAARASSASSASHDGSVVNGERVIVGCGRGLPDQQIVVVDPVTCTRCPNGQNGEIWIAGPSVADGYWNRPMETAEAFGARLADTGEGPFLRTGDLGCLDGDELFVTGRLKDLIIIDGSNHYPQDLESTVESCHPAVEPHGSAAFAVSVGGVEHAIVVAELARAYMRDVRASSEWRDLVVAIRSAVSTYHGLRLREVVLVRTRTIPKNGAGKIQRFLCRSGYLSNSLSVVWRERQPAADEDADLLSSTV